MKIKDSIFQKTVRGAVELLHHDFEELKKLEALTPILKNGWLFKNVLFDILPEFEFKYSVPRAQLIRSAALIREFFVSGPPPSAPEWEKRVKQASKRLEAAADLDDELKYFVLDLYCLELAHTQPPKRKNTKTAALKSVKKRFAWFYKYKKAAAVAIFVFVLAAAGIGGISIGIYNGKDYLGLFEVDADPRYEGTNDSELFDMGKEQEQGGINHGMALHYYEQAANKGNVQAIKRLSEIYGAKSGLTNKVKALYYANRFKAVKSE